MAIEIGISESPGDIGKDFAEAAKFTEEELNMNRALKISNAQMIRLAIQAMRPLYSATVTLIGWLVFVYVVKMFLPGILQMVFWGKTIGGFGVLMIGCVWAVIVAFLQTSRLTALLLLDVTRGVTAQIEGPVNASWTEVETQGLDRFHGEKKSSFHYIVKGEEFEVNERAYDLLHNKYDLYRPKVRLFYTPRSKMLLSIEPI